MAKASFERMEQLLEPEELVDELMAVVMQAKAVQPELAVALAVASQRDYKHAVQRTVQLLTLDPSFARPAERLTRGLKRPFQPRFSAMFISLTHLLAYFQPIFNRFFMTFAAIRGRKSLESQCGA